MRERGECKRGERKERERASVLRRWPQPPVIVASSTSIFLSRSCRSLDEDSFHTRPRRANGRLMEVTKASMRPASSLETFTKHCTATTSDAIGGRVPAAIISSVIVASAVASASGSISGTTAFLRRRYVNSLADLALAFRTARTKALVGASSSSACGRKYTSTLWGQRHRKTDKRH